MWKEEQRSLKKTQPEFTGKYREEFALHKRPSYSLNYPIGNTFYSSGLQKRLSVGNKESLPLIKTSNERSWNQLDCSPVDEFVPFVDIRKNIKRGSKDFFADQTELLLDEKTQKLLSRTEKITLNFYCNEYITKAMTIDAFVAVLLELFDQPSKYTLMTEIRGLVRGEDLDKFDELIYRRELQALKSKVAQRFVGGENSPRRIHSSKKNSGVDFVNNSYQIDGRKTSGQQKTTRGISHHYSFNIHQPRKSARALQHGMLRRHSSGGEVDDYTGYLDLLSSEDRRWSVGNVGNNLIAVPPPDSVERNQLTIPLEPKTMTLEVPRSHVRRHRSLPDPHARSRPQEHHSQQRSASVRLPGHRIIQENDGTLRVVIKKTKPLLGIVIEGGVNTPQPLPRIISIHTSGAAFEAGGLKIGHIILEVDGMKMKRKRHSEVAKFIANAFYNSDKDQIEFLVTERTKTPLELRRSSFMVTD
ncbi:uncharacterized protein LOC111622977 [Centruroides sculpturatus]|uniref:uncharacterized protein LOC111622977 n=1 Tax=Centruroides sculpturatus TaxID=218467 RepID=UPI000C6CAB43|nr:uncharacterized protein LOC111622977 [Centruroides sculpturatus]